MKKKNIVLLIVLLAIGFATVSTTLVINGLLAIGESDDFNIIFTNAVLDGSSRKKFISDDKQNITFTSNVLKSLKDTSTLEYEVTNTSRNYDAEVAIECNIVDDEGQIEESNDYFTIAYEPASMELLAGETKTGSITAELTRVVEDDASYKIKCTLNATPTTRDDLGSEYIEPFANAGTMIAVSSNSFWKNKSNITNIVFENKSTVHETTEELTYDVTAEGSVSPVMAYLVPNEDDTTKYTAYINSDGGVKANPDASYYFGGFYNLTEISGLEYFDTSDVTNLSGMFNGCSGLTSLDLTHFNTKKVTDMHYMFQSMANKNKLELDLSNFDLSNVETIDYMFQSVGDVKSIIFPEGEASKLTSANGVFDSTSTNTISYVSMKNLSLPNITNVSSFFHQSGIVDIDLENLNIPNVTSLYHLFAYCNKLNNVNLSGIKTGNLTTLEYMFYGCSSLTDLDLTSLVTDPVTNMKYAFQKCTSLKNVNLSSFNTSNVKDMGSMFSWCESLEVIDLSNFTFDSILNTGYNSLFDFCYKLREIHLVNFDFTNSVNLGFISNYGKDITLYLDNAKFDYTKEYDRISNWSGVKTIRVKDEEMKNYFLSQGEKYGFFNNITYIIANN